jgi:Nitrile hydratase, alpha chain
MNQEEQGKKISQLIAKCWADEGFKQKVLADPAATLRAEGAELPAGLSYVAHENTEKVVHLVIPAKPTDLSDEDLGDVVAGHGVLLGDLYPNDPRGCGITPSACRMTAFF